MAPGSGPGPRALLRHGRQFSVKVREHPIDGVASRLTLIEATRRVRGVLRNWVVVSEQVSTENQNHPLGRPIRLTEISCQRRPDRRKPAAVTVAVGGRPGPRVAVRTTLKLDKVDTASCRRCGWLAPVALNAAVAVSMTAAVIRAPIRAARRIVAEINGTPPRTTGVNFAGSLQDIPRSSSNFGRTAAFSARPINAIARETGVNKATLGLWVKSGPEEIPDRAAV
jgi:hypothetical protein